MNLTDLPPQAAFRLRAREWIRQHAPWEQLARIRRMRFAGQPFDTEHEWLSVARQWQRRKFDAGWACLVWPREYGGQGLSPTENVIFQEEEGPFAELFGPFMIGQGFVAPTLMAYASEAHRRRFLPLLASGESIWCQLFSEPGAGSDLASLSTRAVRDGDDWIVTGQKVWTSGAHLCDLGELLVRTDPDAPKHKGISAFLVDLHAPGVDVRPLRQMTGGASFNEVFLDEVRIPDDHRLAAVNDGWSVAMTTLLHERELIGAGGGDGRQFGSVASFERVAATAGHFGRTADPVVRQGLAAVYVAGRLAAMNAARAAATATAGAPPGPEMAGAKLALAANLRRIADLLGVVLGPHLAAGSGVWGGFGWLEFVLGAPGIRIAGGTDEVLRNVIAERVLGLPR